MPKSEGRFVDGVGYIRAELSDVALIQVRCSAAAVFPRGSEQRAMEPAGWQQRAAPEPSPAGDINGKSHYPFLLS